MLNAPCSGTLSADDWLAFLDDDPLVRRVSYFKRRGDPVTGPEDGVPDWLAEVIVVGTTSQHEVNERVRRIVTHEAPVPILPARADAPRSYYFPGDAYPFAPLARGEGEGA